MIADTVRTVTLREAFYPGMHCISRDDGDMAALLLSEHGTYCPCKGDTIYFGVDWNGGRIADVASTYEHPYPAVTGIRGHSPSTPTGWTASPRRRPILPPGDKRREAATGSVAPGRHATGGAMQLSSRL